MAYKMLGRNIISSWCSSRSATNILKSKSSVVNFCSPQDILGSNVLCRKMAGHSKWQNIKHIKALKDSQRSLLFSKHAAAIRRTCLEGGGANPKLNSKLFAAIEQARADNMPNSTIDTLLKRFENKKMKEHKMELMGPGGCYLIIEMETDQVHKAIHDIKTICRRKGGLIMEEGRTRMLFDYKGIVRVLAKRDGELINSENALEDAILAGAEDVKDITQDENEPQLEFICDVNDFFKVRKAIEDAKYEVLDSGLEYVPVQRIALSDNDMNRLAELCTALQDHQDVQKVYDNIQ